MSSENLADPDEAEQPSDAQSNGSGAGIEEKNGNPFYGLQNGVSVTDKTVRGDVAHYVCPKCPSDRPQDRFNAGNEHAVRAHITRERDAYHNGYNAFGDRGVIVQIYDDAWKPVGERSAPKSPEFEGVEETELLPDDVDPEEAPKTAEILRYAIVNPEASQRDISKAVYGDTSGRGYVSKVLSEYLASNMSMTNETTTAAETETSSGGIKSRFKDLKPTQQRALREKARDAKFGEGLNYPEIGERVGLTAGAVRYNLEKYEDMYEHLLARAETRYDMAPSTKSWEEVVDAIFYSDRIDEGLETDEDATGEPSAVDEGEAPSDACSNFDGASDTSDEDDTDLSVLSNDLDDDEIDDALDELVEEYSDTDEEEPPSVETQDLKAWIAQRRAEYERAREMSGEEGTLAVYARTGLDLLSDLEDQL